jgi:hypothetical protein
VGHGVAVTVGERPLAGERRTPSTIDPTARAGAAAFTPRVCSRAADALAVARKEQPGLEGEVRLSQLSSASRCAIRGCQKPVHEEFFIG